MPPDVTACSNLPPGAPCPMPDACVCNYERDQRTSIWSLTLLVFGLLLTAVIVMALLISVYAGMSKAFAADNDTPCLSYAQAKAKYHGAYLYWHGHDGNRCWDNKRIYAKPVKANKSGRLDATKIDNLQYQDEAEKRLRSCCWPVLPSFAPWHDRIDGNI